MKILAIDCSTEACSVALSDNGELTECFELAAREHTQKLLPMVSKILSDSELSLSQIDAIGFGRGPGSFTGLRICLGAVQGLAFGSEIPVIPISSLAALAQTAIDAHQIADSTLLLSTLDARMDEIYWGVYQATNGLVELQGSESLTTPEQLVIPQSMFEVGEILAIGHGLNYGQRIACAAKISMLDATLLPRASAVLRLACSKYQEGHLLSAHEALPLYLRDQVTWKKLAEQ
jgi:tRNA threonylcarbamoyladenosine biosynthesis protein TsaB